MKNIPVFSSSFFLCFFFFVIPIWAEAWEEIRVQPIVLGMDADAASRVQFSTDAETWKLFGFFRNLPADFQNENLRVSSDRAGNFWVIDQGNAVILYDRRSSRIVSRCGQGKGIWIAPNGKFFSVFETYDGDEDYDGPRESKVYRLPDKALVVSADISSGAIGDGRYFLSKNCIRDLEKDGRCAGALPANNLDLGKGEESADQNWFLTNDGNEMRLFHLPSFNSADRCKNLMIGTPFINGTGDVFGSYGADSFRMTSTTTGETIGYRLNPKNGSDFLEYKCVSNHSNIKKDGMVVERSDSYSMLITKAIEFPTLPAVREFKDTDSGRVFDEPPLEWPHCVIADVLMFPGQSHFWVVIDRSRSSHFFIKWIWRSDPWKSVYHLKPKKVMHWSKRPSLWDVRKRLSSDANRQ